MKPVTRITADDIPTIVDVVCKEYIILRSSHEMQQFKDGLNVLDVGYLVTRHPTTLKQIFVHDPTLVVSSRYLKEAFVPLFASQGSNVRDDQEAVYVSWNYYLDDLEGMHNYVF